jgi:hypothetical protein
MQLDYETGRPLEWEAIYQAPIQTVRALGGSMPKCEALMYQLAFLSLRGAGTSPDVLI